MNKQNCSLFYGTGCCDMVSRYEAIKSIGSRAKQESSIPISIGGVGNTEIKSNHGIFQVNLPLFNGSEGTFSGVCLDQITVKFHQYPLKGITEEHIAAGYKRQGNNPRDLPQLPQFVGGNTVLPSKKCSNYHLDSQYKDLALRMQITIEVLLVVNIKCSQRLNSGIT